MDIAAEIRRLIEGARFNPVQTEALVDSFTAFRESPDHWREIIPARLATAFEPFQCDAMCEAFELAEQRGREMARR